MINALGALYILNLYYADEKFWFETPIEHRRLYTSSSEIFTPALCDTTKLPICAETDNEAIHALTNPTLQESIFILKHTDSAYSSMQEAIRKLVISVNVKPKRSACDKGTQPTIDDYEALVRQESGVVRDAFRELVHKEVILNKNINVSPDKEK